MTTYVPQTDLGELLGVSFEEMDKILIERGLKNGELATKKAIDEDYVHLTFLEDSRPFYHWNIIKISELIGRKLLDEVGFYVDSVLMYMHMADADCYSFEESLLIASCAYDDVPVSIRAEVRDRVTEKMLGMMERQNSGSCIEEATKCKD
jgi:hypothetical protein